MKNYYYKDRENYSFSELQLGGGMRKELSKLGLKKELVRLRYEFGAYLNLLPVILLLVVNTGLAQGGESCANASAIGEDGTYTADFSGAGDEEQWFSYTFLEQGMLTVTALDCDADMFIEWKSDCFNNIKTYWNSCSGSSPQFESSFTYLGTPGEQIYLVMDEVFDLDNAQNDLAITTESRNNIDTILSVTAREYSFNGTTYSSSGSYEAEDTLMSSQGMDSIVYLKLTIDTNYGAFYSNPEPVESDGEIEVDNFNLNNHWFYYEPPQNGILVVSTCGYTSANTKIIIYGESGESTPLAQSDNSFICGNQSELYYEVQENDKIWIRFDGVTHGINEMYTASVETRDNAPGSWYGNTIEITEGIHTVNHAAVGGDVYYYVDLLDDFETAGLRISTCDAATTNTSFEVYFDEFGASLNPPLFDSEDGFSAMDCGNGLETMDATGLELGSWIIRFQDVASTSSYDFEMTNMDFCDAFGLNNGSTQNITEEVSYEFDSQTLTESGTYTATFLNRNACDSVVTLNLSIGINSCANPTILSEGEHELENTSSEFWVSYTPDQNGTLTVERTDNVKSIDMGLWEACNSELVEVGYFEEDFLIYGLEAGRTYLIYIESLSTDETQSIEISFDSAIHGYSCYDPLWMDAGTHEVSVEDMDLGRTYLAVEWPENGTFTFSTCPDNAPTNDIKLTIYNSHCNIEAEVDDNDADCGPYGRETYEVHGLAGETKVVLVSSLAASQVNTAIEITFQPSTCDYVLTDLPTTGVYTADNSGSEFSDGASAGDNYFRYVAEQTGILFVSTLGHAEEEGVNTYIILDDDCDRDNGALNTSNNFGGLQSFLQESVTMGEEYIIILDDFNTDASYDFEIGYISDEGLSCEHLSSITEGPHNFTMPAGILTFEYTATEAGDLIITTHEETYINVYSEGSCNLLNYGDLGSYDRENGDTGQILTVEGLAAGQKVVITYGADHSYLLFTSIILAGTENTWIGAASNNWFDADNWTSNVPDINSSVRIASSQIQPVVIGDAAVNNMTIEAEAVLTIESGSALNIQGTVGGAGEAIVKRNTVGNAGYSIIGSPVQNAEIDALDADFLYAFDGTDYVVPTGQLKVGEGYFAAFNEESPFIAFEGELNSGEITRTMDSGGEFMLLSNPYAAAISWSDFVADNTDVFDGTIYLWDDGGINEGATRGGGYVTVNNMGATGTAGIKGPGQWAGNITSMQGFYIYVDQPGDVTFDPTHITSSANANGDGTYYRAAEKTLIRLALSNESTRDELLIGFTEEATPAFDRSLDARKLRNNHISFFSLLEEQELAIQALPWTITQTIPLGLAVSQPGNYKVAISDLEGMREGINVILMDKHYDKEYDLREGEVTIELAEKEVVDRYSLLVEEGVLHVKGIANFSVTPSSESLLINYPSDRKERVLISTIAGQTLFNGQVDFQNGQTTIRQAFSQNMIYIVRVGEEVVKFLISK